MGSCGFYFLVFLLALAAYLAAKTDRARMPPGGGPTEPPGPLADVFFYFSKWVAIVSFFLFFLPALVESWPPRWLEHRTHRRQTTERIVAAGGWNRLLIDTAALLTTNQSRFMQIRPRSQTNFLLPPTVAALKPREIELNPAQASNSAIYRIFGYKSSGMRGQANYWLVVVAENAASNAPAAIASHFHPARTLRPITNGVFEVY